MLVSNVSAFSTNQCVRFVNIHIVSFFIKDFKHLTRVLLCSHVIGQQQKFSLHNKFSFSGSFKHGKHMHMILFVLPIPNVDSL